MKREDIFLALKRNMCEVVEGATEVDITEAASLVDDFGADSLEVVEVVSRTMKELRIRVPRTRLAEPKNIGELVDLFAVTAGIEA
jgi:acyl carrier protein